MTKTYMPKNYQTNLIYVFYCPKQDAQNTISKLKKLFPKYEFSTKGDLQYSTIFERIYVNEPNLVKFTEFLWYFEDNILMDNYKFSSFSEYLLNTPLEELQTAKYLSKRGE